MKKLISLILALALVMSMSAVVFAEDQTNVSVGDYTADVTGTYVAGTTGGTIFSVDIAWAGMSFTYHAEQQPVWNVETHTYSEAVAAYWEGEGTITVTNHSNAKISATPTYTKNTGFESANMSFSTGKLNLASAADTNAAVVGTITVTPSGSLPANTEDATIGTITVTISEYEDITVSVANKLVANARTFFTTIVNLDYPEDIINRAYYMNSLADDLSTTAESFEAGTATQEELNADYEDLLRVYNELKAQTAS